ncbi:protein of unknown function (DUF4373) [Apibacter mensalis]|uniref:Lin1244/Lin1753-like N-terminal domain-containing protein n=1 Tax=Apibacter mensalis TaxID=1586267 RepID=A0A0X3AS07_9FLAO|nr:DUF4373 domain-containing protein [Apibacter mensalis]CVK17191.1 protein of unknown function (DUF4373) [Apibacter mensalis]
MLKETCYFSHDCNARNDEKIIAVRMRYGAEGYGIYFMIIERLLESANYMSVKDYNVVAFDLRVDAKKVKEIVEDFGLFEFSEDKKHFFSSSLNNRVYQLDEMRKKLSKSGKREAKTKQGISDIEATLKPPLSLPQTLNESKEKEIKVNENKDYHTNKKEKIPEQIVIPKAFEPIWEEWKAYRKAARIKSYAGSKWEQIAVNRLIELSKGDEEQARKIVNNSISNGWTGLFKLKSENNDEKRYSEAGNYENKVKRIAKADTAKIIRELARNAEMGNLL